MGNIKNRKHKWFYYFKNLISVGKRNWQKNSDFPRHYKTVGKETTHRNVVSFVSLSWYKIFQSRPGEKLYIVSLET